MFQTKVVEKIKTRISYSPPPRKSSVYEIMWKTWYS